MTTEIIQKASKIQKEFSKKVILKNFLPKKIKTICGIDVSYSEKMAFCSSIILDKNTKNTIESTRISEKISSPYIPGFFMLRESGIILNTLQKLKSEFDLLLIDGHGRLHPRLCGIACYIGIKINKPTIGIAKKLLCGEIKSKNKIEYNGKVLGSVINFNKKRIYVSIGHKVTLQSAVKIVKELTLEGRWYPEPLRLADLDSKEFRREYI